MPRRVLLALLAAGLACSSKRSPPGSGAAGSSAAPKVSPSPSPAPAPPAPPLSTATGLDLAGMDRSVRPGDDFFAYANGDVAEDAPRSRPTAAPGAPARSLAELTAKRTAELIAEAATANAPRRLRRAQGRRLLRDASWTRRRSRRRALAPLKPTLDAIAAIADARGARARARRRRCAPTSTRSTPPNFYTDNLFGLWVAQDLDEPTRYVAVPAAGRARHAGPRLLPRRRRRGWPRSATKYQAHIAARARSSPAIADAEAKAARDLRRSRRSIAEAHATPRGRRRTSRRATTTGRAPTSRPSAPGPRLGRVLRRRRPRRRSRSFIVWQPRRGRPASPRSCASEPLDDVEGLPDLPRHRARTPAFLPKAFVDERFAFYGKALAGTPQQRDRWKRAVDATERRARRGRRQALRRALLPARGEGARRGDGDERDRRVRPAHRPPRLDGAGDQGEGEGEARRR